jgi:hypothetical protein
MFVVCGIKIFLDTLGDWELVELPWWRVFNVQFAFTPAVLASAAAIVLVAIILYVDMLVKVGMDKDNYLTSGLKPELICVFIMVGSASFIVQWWNYVHVREVSAPPPPHNGKISEGEIYRDLDRI